MRLLVSVRNADEARAALDGGAAIIDAKEPARGALGAVEWPVLRAIHEVVGDACPSSAALGDAEDPATIADAAHRAAALGFTYVKLGVRGERDADRARELLRAAVDGAHAAHRGTQVIAVAYADAESVDTVPPRAIIEVAARAGAHGVLLDTAVKAGGGLLELMTASAITEWVDAAHRASLLAALAGKLQRDDLPIIAAVGADVVGVRGAACDGGREGRVSVARVRALADVVRHAHVSTPASMPASQESGCPTDTGRAIPSAFSFR